MNAVMKQNKTKKFFNWKKSVLSLLLSGCLLFFGCQGVTPDSSAAPSVATPSGNTGDVSASPVFTPSATESQDPTKPLAGMKIFLDPGHQEKSDSEKEPNAPWGPEANAKYNNTVMKNKCSSGTQGSTSRVEEYVVTLQISLALRDALQDLGAEVRMARETHSVRVSNKERAEMGNEFGADVVLRIHCNGTDNSSVKGMEVWVRDKGDGTAEYRQRAQRDHALASELLDQLILATDAGNRGVKASDSYTGINWSQVPCIIIECGFMSNPEEDMLLCSEAYQKKIVSGIVQWFLTTEQFSSSRA